MTNFLLLINNIDTDSKHIYNLQPVHYNNVSITLHNILSHLQLSNQHLQLESRNLNEYIIYDSIDTIKHGWIWNTTSLKKQIHYIISLIPILHNNDNNNNNNELLSENNLPSKITLSFEPFDFTLVTNELKNILQQPNFGLKSTKQNIS
jgi:hypothetical protein